MPRVIPPTKEYRAWANMWQRCTNPKNSTFKFYGDRGITVCDRWKSSTMFIADVGPSPSEAHTLERINNSIGYCPSNVKWALIGEQTRNRRSTNLISFNGKTMCLRDWADTLGISRLTLTSRFRIGMSIEEALTRPLRTMQEHERTSKYGTTKIIGH